MANISLSSNIIKNDSLVASELDDGLVMMSLENSSYYGLDPIGKRVWEILEEKTSVENLISKLIEEYDISKDECQKDILELLNSFAKENLIIVE
ncbi:MAG: lasso peptide biosynthesis PqqD family chaperone [Candidatus Sericytochromatia bacterium]